MLKYIILHMHYVIYYTVLCESDPALLAVRQPRRTAHALPRLVRGDFTLPTYIYMFMHQICAYSAYIIINYICVGLYNMLYIHIWYTLANKLYSYI